MHPDALGSHYCSAAYCCIAVSRVTRISEWGGWRKGALRRKATGAARGGWGRTVIWWQLPPGVRAPSHVLGAPCKGLARYCVSAPGPCFFQDLGPSVCKLSPATLDLLNPALRPRDVLLVELQHTMFGLSRKPHPVCHGRGIRSVSRTFAHRVCGGAIQGPTQASNPEKRFHKFGKERGNQEKPHPSLAHDPLEKGCLARVPHGRSMARVIICT